MCNWTLFYLAVGYFIFILLSGQLLSCPPASYVYREATAAADSESDTKSVVLLLRVFVIAQPLVQCRGIGTVTELLLTYKEESGQTRQQQHCVLNGLGRDRPHWNCKIVQMKCWNVSDSKRCRRRRCFKYSAPKLEWAVLGISSSALLGVLHHGKGGQTSSWISKESRAQFITSSWRVAEFWR